MIKIEKDNGLKIRPQDLVSVKKMGSIYEICYLKSYNKGQTIQLIDKDHYMIMNTGEVLECNHIENRSQSKAQVAQSLKRLRDYINTNVVYPKNCKWIPLEKQPSNRRSVINIEYNGDTKMLTEWARYFNISHSTIQYHLKKGTVKECFDKYSKQI